MNLVIGLFKGETALANAVRQVMNQGIAAENISFIQKAENNLGRIEPVRSVGFLADDQLQAGDLITALTNNKLSALRAAAYLAAVRRGYFALVVRGDDKKLAWATEAMRRSSYSMATAESQ